MLAGFTDYSSQSLNDILIDLKEWINTLEDTNHKVNNLLKELEKSLYFSYIDEEFLNYVKYSLSVYESSKNEIVNIIKDMEFAIKEHHVKRLNRIGKQADKINRRIGKIWHQVYTKTKDYNNPNFVKVEFIYSEIGDTAADLLDISNASDRLDDFVGMKLLISKKNKIDDVNEIIELKPNFFGLGINMNKIISKLKKKLKK